MNFIKFDSIASLLSARSICRNHGIDAQIGQGKELLFHTNEDVTLAYSILTGR